MNSEQLTPWLSEKEISFMEGILANGKRWRVLEFGSGGSTVHFSPMVKQWFSIEHNYKWFQDLQPFPPNCFVYFAPPDFHHFGFQPAQPGQFYHYTRIYTRLINKKIDLLFVDGRDRVEVVRQNKGHLKKGGLVLVHDFDRERYQPLRSEAGIRYVQTVDRLGVFRKL